MIYNHSLDHTLIMAILSIIIFKRKVAIIQYNAELTIKGAIRGIFRSLAWNLCNAGGGTDIKKSIFEKNIIAK